MTQSDMFGRFVTQYLDQLNGLLETDYEIAMVLSTQTRDVVAYRNPTNEAIDMEGNNVKETIDIYRDALKYMEALGSSDREVATMKLQYSVSTHVLVLSKTRRFMLYMVLKPHANPNLCERVAVQLLDKTVKEIYEKLGADSMKQVSF